MSKTLTITIDEEIDKNGKKLSITVESTGVSRIDAIAFLELAKNKIINDPKAIS